MKSSNKREYKKPSLKKHGDIKTITQGAWPSQGDDGTEGFSGSA